MSRDQRPRRDVLVDSAPDLPAAAKGATGAGGDPVAAADPVAAKPHLLIPSILFLLACAAGAVGIAMMPLGGM